MYYSTSWGQSQLQAIRNLQTEYTSSKDLNWLGSLRAFSLLAQSTSVRLFNIKIKKKPNKHKPKLTKMGHYTYIYIYINNSAFSNEFQIHTPPTQTGSFSLHRTHAVPVNVSTPTFYSSWWLGNSPRQCKKWTDSHLLGKHFKHLLCNAGGGHHELHLLHELSLR